VSSRALRGGFACAGGVNALADDAARDGGMFVKPFAEAFVDDLFDVALDVAVEFSLVWPSNCGCGKRDADDGDKTFANVIARDADFVLLLFGACRWRKRSC